MLERRGCPPGLEDLRNRRPDRPSALPLLRALWTPPSAENLCLCADAPFLSPRLGAVAIKPVLKHHILLSSPFFDDDCQP